MTLNQMVEELNKKGCLGSTPAELHLIEKRANLRLPESFRKLWLSVGGCKVVAKITCGRLEGEYVSCFLNAQEILKKLDEDYRTNETSMGHVVPFANDFFGNTFFLRGVSGVADEVLIADWNNQTIKLAADCFDEFLGSLDFQQA